MYIDYKNKEITAIDPGSGAAIFDEIEIDISRFLVNIFATKNIQIILLNRIINKFFSGYGTDTLSFSKLDNQIKNRVFKNFTKTINLGSGIKKYFNAYLSLVFSKINYLLIKKKLKNKLEKL